jgi:hypothetical protein
MIVYATGFDFSFPFLSIDSGLTNNDKKVYPLYKHCININRPSLAFIGLPCFSLAMPKFDLQVRFCLQFWSGRKQHPSKEEMMADTDQEFEQRRLKDSNNHNVHCLSLGTTYYRELAEAAEIEPMKPVYSIAWDDCIAKFFGENPTFRKYNYKILNDEEFECTYWGNK